MAEIIKKLCELGQVNLTDRRACIDYFHMYVVIPHVCSNSAKKSVSDFMLYLKGKSA